MHYYQHILRVLAVLLLGLTACTPRPTGDTPEAALEQLLRQDPEAPADTRPYLRIHGTRVTPHGVVLLYSAEYRTDQGQVVASRSSYALLDRQPNGEGWFPTSATINAPPNEDTMVPVVFFEWPIALETGSMLIVYGWTKPEVDVTTIDVVLDVGPPMRDTVTNGMFAVVTPDAAATVVCELRAFDAHNRVVYHYRAATTARDAPPEIQQRIARCQP